MLPEGWRSATVADVCDFASGHGFGPDDWDDHGLPIIRIQNLNGGDKFDYYSGKPETKWLVQPGQLLFAWAGTRGVSFGPCIWRGPTGVLNQHIFKVSPKGTVDPDWLHCALRHVTDRIERRAHGFKATLLHVKKSDIERQPIAVPPVAEQRAVQSALAAWDQAIVTSERLLANSHAQRMILGQQLLAGKRRLQSTTAWQQRPVSHLIRESRVPGSGGHLAQKLTVKLYGKGVTGKLDKRAGSESTQYFRRSGGQFIYSKLDFLNGAFGLIPSELDGYESTLDLPAFDFLHGVDPRWFLHFVSREEFYRSHLGLANGGRKARRVNPKDLLLVSIPVPSLSEQRAIADVLELAEEQMRSAERELALLRDEKAALMQQLLIGNRRFPLHEPAEVSPA